MVIPRRDLTGEVFGRLTVIKQTEDYVEPKSGEHRSMWLCECSCEDRRIIKVMGSNLTKKNGTRSCGCIRTEKLSARMQEMAPIFNAKKHKTNVYDLSGEYGVGLTSNTQNEFYFDLEDYDKIKDYCWHETIGKDGVHRLGTYDPKTKKQIAMHALLGFKNFDHADRNELNNRKINLRPCTNTENNYNRNRFSNNTSGYTGVTFITKSQKWRAFLYKNNELVLNVCFDNKEDAINARKAAEEIYCNGFSPQDASNAGGIK
jgi:GTP:adenosylcobinamide-phosphate guanylyltransferase